MHIFLREPNPVLKKPISLLTVKKLTLLILAIISAAFAAQASLWRNYQTGDGLSHNSVWAVMQDSRGFMWFGTNDGLNRFDGLKFKVYRRVEGDTSTLGNNFIHCMLEDPDGDIFVGTKEGLYKYNVTTDDFTHIPLDGQPYGKDKNSIHQLLFDKDGDLWIGCYGQGLYCMEKGSGKITHIVEPKIPSNSITSMAADQQGNIWLGTDNKGLFRYNKSSRESSSSSIPNTNIQTIFRQNNNTIWVGTAADGLYHYDPRSDSFTRVNLARNNTTVRDIKAITFLDNNTLLMGSSEGLLKLDCSTETLVDFDRRTAFDNLPDNSIFAIEVDKEGSIWLGTYFSGVSQWASRTNAFEYFPVNRNNSASTNIIKQFSIAPDGNVIICSRNDGINILNPKTHTVTNLPIGGLSDNVQLAVSIDNELWVSDYNRGLVVASYPSGGVLKKYTTAEGLPTNVVNAIYRTSRGQIYAGTNRGAARLVDGKFEKIPELRSASIMTILEDYDGNLWFATHFYGLMKMSPSGKFTNYSVKNSSLPGDNINNIFLDSHGKMWVGTEGKGLVIFNTITGKTEKIFSEMTGLPSDIIYSAREDGAGNIWATTGGGLVRIAGDTHEIQNFKYLENLLKIHYAHNSSTCTPDNGTLYFGGSGGFVSFDPTELTPNATAPMLNLVDFSVRGNRRPLNPEGKIELESYESTFSLDVACLSYLSPEQNTVSYRLVGFDEEWRTLSGTDYHIEYMNLPWGTYKLEIKGANNDGVWSDPTELQIKVNRPLLLSNSMLIVYFLMLIAMFWFAKRRFDYLQRRKMVQFSHEKEKELYEAKIGFFTNIAHEIRTPLSLISAPLETILSSGDGNNRTRHNLQVMQSNVHRLLELINQLLDFRKVEAQLMRMNFRNCNVCKIVEDIAARYEEFAHLNMIKIDTRNVAPDIHCTLDAEAFEKIVGNLMSNAIKFANKHISLTLRKEDSANRMIVEVNDDGPGIKEKELEKIFESFYQIDDHSKHPGSGLGLPLARRLAELHNGTLTVTSEYGKGSTFILSIPTSLEAGEPEMPRKESPEDAEAAALPPQEKETGKSTVLIVEDNDELRAFVADNMAEKYNVLTAGNGIEAMKLLEKKHVDMIVSDIMMPDMDGIALCRAIRSNPTLAHIPVVLLSAKTDVETKVEGLNIGANAYMEKPFSIEQLRAQVKSILEARRRLQESLMKSPLDYYKQEHKEDVADQANAEFVNKLNDYIIENIANPDFNIDAAARRFAMSRSSFHSKVKSITGETPNNYIRVVKLCKAAELLASGKYQIVEVCYMVGFNTPSYFSKCFSEHFGKLPKDYIADLNK